LILVIIPLKFGGFDSVTNENHIGFKRYVCFWWFRDGDKLLAQFWGIALGAPAEDKFVYGFKGVPDKLKVLKIGVIIPSRFNAVQSILCGDILLSDFFSTGSGVTSLGYIVRDKFDVLS